MKFEKPIAVTILKPHSLEVTRTRTDVLLKAPWHARTVGEALDARDEGVYWIRGHDDEAVNALLAARALR